MSDKIPLTSISILALTSLWLLIPASAQISPLSVTTDKNAYLPNNSITISGKAYSASGMLGIQVLDPSNRPVYISQTNANPDGTYSVTITAGGQMWNTSGTYTVIVNEQGNTAQTSFTFSVPAITLVTETSHVLVPNSQQTFDVSYTIVGGTVNNMSVDLKGLSLDISITSDHDGSITLQIPRQLLDAKTNSGQDDDLIVSVDSNQVQPQNKFNNDMIRTMTIYFYKGSTDIKITGTEFPFQSDHVASPNPVQQSLSPSNVTQKIPAWVRNVFIWYGQGKITEDDLLSAIKFLVDSGVIQLQSK